MCKNAGLRTFIGAATNAPGTIPIYRKPSLHFQPHFCTILILQPEIVSTLKRTAEAILNKGGIIRELENLGTRALPHKISEHGLVHREASYFIVRFDAPPRMIASLKEEYGRDIDIVRRNILKLEPEPPFQCTLDQELQPPAYRKEVIEMVAQAKKRDKKPYDHRSGLDYYPFQK